MTIEQTVQAQRRFLREVPFGGCVNDTIIHLATSRMGFGGVGMSGRGSYHAKKSVETFSHEKSVVKKHTWMELPVRYAPYSRVKDALLRLNLRSMISACRRCMASCGGGFCMRAKKPPRQSWRPETVWITASRRFSAEARGRCPRSPRRGGS